MLAMAAVLATLEAIESDGMIPNAKTAEHHLRKGLQNVAGIKAVHGKGCLLGIEFIDECAPIHAKLLENKIITGTSSNPSVLRLLPPLCVKLEEIDLFVASLNG